MKMMTAITVNAAGLNQNTERESKILGFFDHREKVDR